MVQQSNIQKKKKNKLSQKN